MFWQIAPDGEMERTIHVPVEGEGLTDMLHGVDRLNLSAGNRLGGRGGKGGCPFIVVTE
jgi:hypothetical protein